MEKLYKNILSTRPLSEPLLQEAAAKGLIIDCIAFIETAAVASDDIALRIKEIAAQKTVVIFTSMNAVEAVQPHVAAKPDWRIYAIGNTTRQLAAEHFGPVNFTADNASALADLIIANGESEAHFFCGDIRRDELPAKLTEAGIALQEVMVYRTHLLPQKIDKQYDAVLFYSPSAVHAFFETNTLLPETIVFAIGETTSAALNTYTNNRIYVTDSPSKEGLVRDMMEFFSNANTTE